MNLSEAVRIADSLRGTFIRRHTPDSLTELVRPLLDAYRIYGIGRSAHQVWWRARKCQRGKHFDCLKDLIYPPADLVGWNRANRPGQPTLYASWNVATALEEIAAGPGDLVQLIALRVLPGIDLPCALIGEYQSIHNSGGSLVNSRKLEENIGREMLATPEEARKLQLYIDSFLAEQFSREFKRAEDYLPNVIVANRILTHFSGLLYPSVANSHAINLAVPAPIYDTNFEVLATFTAQVSTYHGYGLFDAEVRSTSHTFSAAGDIDWQSRTKAPATIFSYQHGYEFDHALSGWQVPTAA